MTFTRSKNIPVFVLYAGALLFLAGCQSPEVVTEDFGNSLEVQVTVKNNTSGTRYIALLPALGKKENSSYRWATGTETNGTANAPVNLDAGAEQVLKAGIGTTYSSGDTPIGNAILSFLLKVDGKEYAGWDAKYGTSGTITAQGYGYAVFATGGNNFEPAWYSSVNPPQREKTKDDGNPGWLTVRYTITITDDGVEFVLNETEFGVLGEL
jgi:hypothetical protein